MKKYLLALFTFCVLNQTYSQRISNSPYPLSLTPDTLFVVDIGSFSPARQLSVVTLQGLLAKTKPQILVERGDPVLLRDLKVNYGVVFDSTFRNDFIGLLSHFKNRFSGYVLYLNNDSSTNAAISLCSPLIAIAVDTANKPVADSLGIQQLYSVIGKGQSWAFDSFQNNYSRDILIYQHQSKCTYLSDYSVFTGAYHFWDIIPQTVLANQALAKIRINGAMLGWGDEHFTCYAASIHGLHLHAADWASNLSVYTNFNVATEQKSHPVDTLLKPGVHTVCFVMTDGDNIQWLLGDFASNHQWYGSPHRGLFNLGWTVSPALAELAPTVLKYLYDSAATGTTGNDYFIAGPSGMGYTYSDVFQPLDSGTAITARMMKKAGLSIVNVIGNAYQSGYMNEYLKQPNIDAVFFYPYQNYEDMHGFSACLNGKPVITPRYSLADGNYTVDKLVNTIDTMPKNPYLPDGYSLVAVNVWSNNVDSVLACIQRFDSTIRVVTPDVFVKLFKAGTNCNALPSGIGEIKSNASSFHVSPNPSSGSINISISENLIGSTLTVTDITGKRIEAVQLTTQQSTLNTQNFLNGIYFLSVAKEGIVLSQKLVVNK